MKALREAIEKYGVGIGTEVVKVDSFLNHRIDVALSTEMGKAFYEAFKDDRVDCILTVEASGIAAAMTAAQAFGNIPVVFAKKGDHRNVGNDVYTAEVYSFTHQKLNVIRVSHKYLEKGFQPGGKNLRESGVKVVSLAIVDAIEDGKIILRDEE